MSEEALEVKIKYICDTLGEIKSDMASLKECKHCMFAPSIKERMRLQMILITVLASMTGTFFLLFLAHILPTMPK